MQPKSRFKILPMLIVLVLLHGWDPSAKAQGQQRVIRNSMGMEFVRIPAGEFIMGSSPDEPFRGKSEIPHRVIITKPFYMQTTEVTLGQWRAVMRKGLFFRWKGDERLPVTKVSWHDVNTFLKKLNAMGKGRYRLPTEAEWEYASRAGSTRAFTWGDGIDCSQAMFANNRQKMDTCQDYLKERGFPLDGPAKVKSYAPNRWGLYDMHGNVWEWVQDWYAPYPRQPQTDPKGPDNGTNRVRRGGSWFKHGYSCRSGNRAYGHPSSRLRTTGFRVIKIANPSRLIVPPGIQSGKPNGN